MACEQILRKLHYMSYITTLNQIPSLTAKPYLCNSAKLKVKFPVCNCSILAYSPMVHAFFFCLFVCFVLVCCYVFLCQIHSDSLASTLRNVHKGGAIFDVFN